MYRFVYQSVHGLQVAFKKSRSRSFEIWNHTLCGKSTISYRKFVLFKFFVKIIQSTIQ